MKRSVFRRLWLVYAVLCSTVMLVSFSPLPGLAQSPGPMSQALKDALKASAGLGLNVDRPGDNFDASQSAANSVHVHPDGQTHVHAAGTQDSFAGIVDDTEGHSHGATNSHLAATDSAARYLGWRGDIFARPNSMVPMTAGEKGDAPKDQSRNMTLLANIPRGGTNSDLAFWGNLAVAGNYDGFRLINIADPAHPAVLSTVACRGPQNDVSIWNNLLFLSVDRPQTLVTCSQDASNPNDPSTFEGVRIFDISNPASPQFVTGVSTDCGSHTHTLIPDLANNRVLLYVSSYFISNGPHCGPGRETDPRHKKISIISVPLSNPASASVIGTPEINADPFNFGSGETIACHDITVFLDLHLAAGACMSEGQLWDITDPVHPQTTTPIARFHNSAFDFWHSAAFSWDARTLLFSDETFSTGCTSPSDTNGRIWIYNNYPPYTLRSSFVQPRPPSGGAYCSAHLYNFLPTTDGMLITSAWYEGGVNLLDLNDASNPREEGYYRATTPIAADTWSTYWYNNYIYAGDISRGFDVFSYTTSSYHQYKQLPYLNPQTQEHVFYPPPNRPIQPGGGE
jgi:hypothetical protein